MDSSSVLARVAGSTLAGAIGFVVGFYAGFFVVLSISGLDTGAVAFVVFTGGLGALALASASRSRSNRNADRMQS